MFCLSPHTLCTCLLRLILPWWNSFIISFKHYLFVSFFFFIIISLSLWVLKINLLVLDIKMNVMLTCRVGVISICCFCFVFFTELPDSMPWRFARGFGRWDIQGSNPTPVLAHPALRWAFQMVCMSVFTPRNARTFVFLKIAYFTQSRVAPHGLQSILFLMRSNAKCIHMSTLLFLPSRFHGKRGEWEVKRCTVFPGAVLHNLIVHSFFLVINLFCQNKKRLSRKTDEIWR